MVFVEISGVLCNRHYRMMCAQIHIFSWDLLKNASAAADQNFSKAIACDNTALHVHGLA